MPSMANLTVKKNDNTTDVTYTTVVASGGEKSPAIWRNNTIGTAPNQRPELRLASRFNGDQSGRRLEGSYSYPSLVTGSDGKVTVANRFNFSFSGIVPAAMPDADLNEAVSQCLHLMATTLMKDQFKTGFAAT